MKCPFTGEELEAYVLDLAGAPRADDIEAHIRSCSSCRDEIDWLRLEQASFCDRRTRSDSNDDLWQGIAAKLGDSASDSQPIARPAATRQRVVWFGSGFAAATMAAAVLVLYLQVPQVSHPRLVTTSPDAAVASIPAAADKPDPAVLALDQAEAEYTTAIAAVEAEYVARRGVVAPALAIAHDRTMSESRRIIGQARAEAGDNIDARVRVLDAYSSHLRTVQAVVAELDPLS